MIKLSLLLMVSLTLVLALTNAEEVAEQGSCTPETCGKPKAVFNKCENTALPTRKWTAPKPAGPGEDDSAPITAYNNDLVLEVIVRADNTLASSDGINRFMRSATVQGLSLTVVDNAHVIGSDELAAVVKTKKDAGNRVIMYLDSGYDALFAGEATEILRKFQDTKSKLVFGAARLCTNLCKQKWPEVDVSTSRYMDTKMFIGYADAVSDLLELILPPTEKDHITEDQILTTLYLNKRDEMGMALDHQCNIFMNMQAWGEDIADFKLEIAFEYNGQSDTRLNITESNVQPAVLRAGGNNQLLNQVSNYIPLSWTPTQGCIHCNETHMCIDTASVAAHPSVFLAFLVEVESPFLTVILDSVDKLDYPKSRIELSIEIADGPSVERYEAIVANWTSAHKSQYKSLTTTKHTSPLLYRKDVFAEAKQADVDYVLLWHSSARLNSDALYHLMSQNRSVVAPAISRIEKLWSNFWGAVAGDFDAQCFDTHASCRAWTNLGECEKNPEWMDVYCPLSCGACAAAGPASLVDYKRAFHYSELVQREKTGLWNVPFITAAILLKKDASSYLLSTLEAAITSTNANEILLQNEKAHFVLDVQVCRWLRQGGFFLNVLNSQRLGRLTDPTGYEHTRVFPDLYLLENNWEFYQTQYIHENYSNYESIEFVKDPSNGNTCWDIYNFPLFNERFCNEFVAQAESYGKWSGADRYGGQPTEDERLSGGYEPVPTQDIHFTQKGLDFAQTWYYVLKWYVAPVAESKWIGYTLDGRTTLDFIVKYRPDGQPFLRPHHDASTFSLNVALNRIGEDFEGGGTRFHRQNCTVLTNKIGHALIHPGRLTHQHEGLYVTKGTRYILVSFVDQ